MEEEVSKNKMSDQKKQNEDTKKKLEEEILKNETIVGIIDEKADEKANEKTELLIKRNNILNLINQDPISNLKGWKAVNEDGYIELMNKLKNIKDNISKTTMQELVYAETEISKAVMQEQKINERFQSVQVAPTPVQPPTNSAPIGLTEILENPKRYSKYIDQEMSYAGTDIYNTKTDEETVNINTLGDRESNLSIKAMNRLVEDFEEIEARNMPYSHYHKIN